ncbi:Myc [Apostichopus japonicus]|uniref:Myc n=1 Tax=Stichopus japonicus TaxID=307972 RepID=A0A2G8L6D8_STIJA|nr:Myc [Apostichopus japonicus]
MTSVCALRVDCGRAVPPMETIEVEEYGIPGWLSDSGATPGDDIWTKFGLEETESIYPTPPLSPDSKSDIGDKDWHETRSDSGFDFGEDQILGNQHSVDITPLLELDCELDMLKPIQCAAPVKPKSELKVSLIQDCMWSAYKKLLQKDSEKLDVNRSKTTQENLYQEFNQPSDCVDPTTVFPYPLSMTETHLDLNIGSQSSSHSDSEEEIDVVTIATIDSTPEEKKRSSSSTTKKDSHKHKHRRMYEVSNPEHDYAKPGPKHLSKLGRSLKRSKSSCSSLSHSLVKRKRMKKEYNPIALKNAFGILGSKIEGSGTCTTQQVAVVVVKTVAGVLVKVVATLHQTLKTVTRESITTFWKGSEEKTSAARSLGYEIASQSLNQRNVPPK